VRLLVENVKNAMVVPVRAVMDTQGMKSIFKVEEDGKVVNQPLTLGFERNSLVVIREGLKPGDMIIADGIRQVRSGMTVKPVVVPMQVDDQPAASGEQPADSDGQAAASGAQPAPAVSGEQPAPVPSGGGEAPAATGAKAE
ncbi:MAG: efflux RND transporter periplasmic adaptor subunit, partial [Pseudodesulfovibrio sp.]|nr:efflux RND transporter periplasmic adaptor subunit [Pseudodesulfovibrio sp.]